MATFRMMRSGFVVAAAAVSLAACTYYRTEERPVAAEPSTVVVQQPAPKTVVVPQSAPSTVVVPAPPGTVIVPESSSGPPNTVIIDPRTD